MKPRRRRPNASTDRIPYKPTRESSRASGDLDDAMGQRDEPAGLHTPERLGQDRRETRPRPSGGDDTPHLTPQDHDADFQENHLSPDDVAALPATASGFDKVPTADQAEEVDEESMYDRRPERDKSRPPSRRGGP